jgi:hypothetical protein
MKLNKARPVAAIQEAHKQASSVLPAPPVELSERGRGYYAEILAGVPAASRQTLAARALAAAISESIEEGEEASRILRSDGYTVTVGNAVKAHPMLAVRDTAARRQGALSARLKLLPSGDHREAVRAASFEGHLRGGLPPTVAAEPSVGGGEIDWLAVLQREKRGRQ